MTHTPPGEQIPFAAPDPLAASNPFAAPDPLTAAPSNAQQFASPPSHPDATQPPPAAQVVPPPPYVPDAPAKRGPRVGIIVAIIIAGLLIAGGGVAGGYFASDRNADPVAQPTWPSPSATPTQEPGSSLEAGVFADGMWGVSIPPSWTASPLAAQITDGLPDHVEIVGAWDVDTANEGLVIMAAFPPGPMEDDQMEAIARASAAGIAAATPDFSVGQAEWGETINGYPKVSVRASGIVDDETSIIQVGTVVSTGTQVVYIVSTSQAILGAIGASETLANSLRPAS